MSYNYNSPIVNNMRMGYGRTIPPNPIGNIVSVGNSGYLSGNYNGRFMSPSQRRHLEEQRIAEERERERQQSDMFKLLSRNVNKGMGNEVSDEYLSEMYDPVYDQRNNDVDEDRFYQLSTIEERSVEFNLSAARQVMNCNRYHENMEKQFPKDMTLTEFYEESYKLKLEMVLDEQKHKQQNLTRLYNKDSYNAMREMHRKIANQYKSVLSDNDSENIDDMTVTRFNLPEKMRQSREERIARFRATCLNK